MKSVITWTVAVLMAAMVPNIADAVPGDSHCVPVSLGLAATQELSTAH